MALLKYVIDLHGVGVLLHKRARVMAYNWHKRDASFLMWKLNNIPLPIAVVKFESYRFDIWLIETAASKQPKTKQTLVVHYVKI